MRSRITRFNGGKAYKELNMKTMDLTGQVESLKKDLEYTTN